MRTVIDWIRKLGPLKDRIVPLIGPFNRLMDAISSVVGFLQTLWGWLKRITGKVWEIVIKIPHPSLPDPGGGVPFIPGVASGGDIARSGLAMVHSGERVLPARVVNRGGTSASGGTVRVIVVGGEQQAIAWLRNASATSSAATEGRCSANGEPV